MEQTKNPSSHPVESSSDRIRLFRQMTRIIEHFYHWTYAPDMTLLYTSCPNAQILQALYEHSDFHNKVLHYAQTHDAPYALGTYMGLVWFAVLEKEAQQLKAIHLLGPVFDSPIQESQMETFLKDYEARGLSFPVRHRLIQQLKNLPVLFRRQFSQLALMLHYCVNGTYLPLDALHFLVDRQPDETTGTSLALYRNIRLRTNELMEIIRLGNIRWTEHSASAREIHYSALPTNAAGIRTPLRSLKDSAVIFTAKCADAAIDGGMSPEAAYTLADQYIGTMEQNCSSMELTALMSSMYRRYVEAVHHLRQPSAKISAPIQACMDYIALHPSGSLKLSTLAEISGYSTYYLSRKFQQETGLSLPRYIKKQKIEQGALLLSSTDLSLSEIAERLGFCSRSHFSDIFHKIMGISPSEYRKKHQ